MKFQQNGVLRISIFSVLHETNDFLIVDKPINLVIHPGAGISSGTLANGLLFKFPKLEELPRAGIVHRLDKRYIWIIGCG